MYTSRRCMLKYLSIKITSNDYIQSVRVEEVAILVL